MKHLLLRLALFCTLCALPASAITVSGTLTTDGGAPMAGATVTIEQVGGELPLLTATTAANGTYSISDPLLFGNVRITPAKSGFRFDPQFTESFTDSNLTNKNFTGISVGQIAVTVVPFESNLPKPASLNLATASIGERKTVRFSITNKGVGPLTGLSASFSGADAADFRIVTALPSMLPSQAANSAPLDIAVQPSLPGVRTAVLHIRSSDSTDDPFDIVLSIEAFGSLRVSSFADSGSGSLRQALSNAAAKPGLDFVLLEPQMAGGLIALDSEISVNDPDGVIVQPGVAFPPLETTLDQPGGGWQPDTPVPFSGAWFYNTQRGTWVSTGQPFDLGLNNFRTTELNSPVITVDQSGEQFLRFRHRYSFESTACCFFDGGQVLISINGEPFRQVAVFAQHGYTGDIVGNSFLPIRGQAVFCGDSPRYRSGLMIDSVVPLGNLDAGQQIRIRFVASYDGSFSAGSPAWEIDTVCVETRTTFTGGLTIGRRGNVNRLLSNGPGSHLSMAGLIFTDGRGGGLAADGAGGAIFNAGILSLSACTLYGNTSGGIADGGAVFNSRSGSLILSRCTLTQNNCAGGRGGAIACDSGGSLALVKCTIARNTALLGAGGIFSTGPLTVSNSIVAENLLSGAVPSDVVASGSTGLTGRNIANSMTPDSPFLGSGTLLKLNPRLAPLAACGGPTPTMALAADSPARDWMSASSGHDLDQRGFATQDLPDIGAYEAGVTLNNFNAYIREHVPAESPSGLYAPDADFDFDGQSNELEWLALTDPAEPDSRFDPSALVLGESMSIRFEAHPARVYKLQQSDTLAPGSWIPAPGVAPLETASGLHSFVVPASAAERRFYRVEPSLPQ